MDRGISTRTVWPIAAEEAIAGKFESIEPSHIFNAVLKMAEIEQRVLASIANDRHSKKLFKKEREATRLMLKQHKIDVPDDSMRIRRAIRARLGSGGFTGHEGWTIHRSDASREITEAAEDLAAKEGSRLVFATHLLKALFAAPDKAMGAVLEEQGVILGWIDVGSDDTSHSGL